MPFDRPSLQEIRDRIAVDFERYGSGDPNQIGTLEHTLANVLAGASHGLHDHLEWNVRQLFDVSADDANLLIRAAEYGITRIAAIKASGFVLATGAAGLSVPEGTLLQDSAETVFRVTASTVLPNSIPVQALEGGNASNQEAGAVLTLLSPIAGIDSDLTVSGGITGGADMESMDRVRTRLADRKQNPPMAGAAHDYVAWAKQAHSDVTRAWVFPNENGVGSIVVRIVTENLSDPIPPRSILNRVFEFIGAVKPAGTGRFSVQAPFVKTINFGFKSLNPNTAEVQQAIRNELDYLFKTEAKPGSRLAKSRIIQAISAAEGERDHETDLTGDIVFGVNEYPILGTLTWPS